MSLLLAVVLGFTVSESTQPVIAQEAPAPQTAPIGNQDEALNEEDKPLVPDTPFPSIIALDERSSVWTLKVSNGRLTVNGDIAVNSSNRGAIWVANASVEAKNGTMSVVGGVSQLGNVSLVPFPAQGGRVVSDPLPQFDIAPPEKVVSREKLFLQTEAGGQDTVLPPGIYYGGIFASGKGHITLQPGVYAMVNGDFSAIGPTVEGQGVTVVMGGDKPGAFSFSLGAKFNASAPTSGRFKDLLVISRAAGNLARGIAFSVAQGQMQGILYAPTSSVSFESKANAQVSKIIAQSLDVTSSTVEVTGALGKKETPTQANGMPAPP